MAKRGHIRACDRWEPRASLKLKKKKAAGIKGVCGKSSSPSSLGPVEKERRRLQHVFQQVSEEKIVNKLLTNLSLDSATTGWECDECGESWFLEWEYTLDGDVDEIGYCYEGPHHPEPDAVTTSFQLCHILK